MENRLENILIECLCNTLNVTLCSEYSGTICSFNSIINHYPIINFTEIESLKKMHVNFRQNQEVHCFIVDSRCVFLDSLFYLLKDYPFWAPVILLRNSFSTDIISKCGYSKKGSYESKDIKFSLYKSDSLGINKTGRLLITSWPFNNYKKLFPIIQRLSITRKLLSKDVPDGLVWEAMNLLFVNNPLSVDKWSKMLDTGPRKLQREFKRYTYFSPKKLIALYHAYRIAFNAIITHNNLRRGVISAYILEDREKTRIMEYVLSHRSKFFYR